LLAPIQAEAKDGVAPIDLLQQHKLISTSGTAVNTVIKANNAMATTAVEQPISMMESQTESKTDIPVDPAPQAETEEQQPAAEEEDDIGEVEPDHYYEGGKIPVFKPTMHQFKDFDKFVAKIDKYGMKSGIVKVIPPKEWRDALPRLDEQVKQIKVKNPIVQHINGGQGAYRQTNLEKQRSYNLVHWRQLCEGSDHQPPARRGERRINQTKPEKKPAKPDKPPTPRAVKQDKSTPVKRGRGRPRKKPIKNEETTEDAEVEAPPTPQTPTPQTPVKSFEPSVVDVTPSVKHEDSDDDDELSDVPSEMLEKPKGRQPKSVSSRRKYNRRAPDEIIDQASFDGFDYQVDPKKLADFTPERCDELEKAYWRTLTYNNPLYGADMPGSLFDDSTTSWNVAKLPNILDVLGQAIPGVNTAYLYLGMWKSTFAWHLEDVDLYSINYIHFGAPKQWYSISQEDARRFETAMKSIWPTDAKSCSQFLRHKTYLVSPQMLQSQFNIRVNKLVHHEGEFVITYPYGYHSGYNLGYNCAESVNFATEAWLEYGRIAKKCDCQEDSVWVDVWDIERRLRGEETDDELSELGSEDDMDLDNKIDMLTPPESVEGASNKGGRKRKRDPSSKEPKIRTKKIKMRLKAPVPVRETCSLCPNYLPNEPLLSTDSGAKAHRVCALYTPETYFAPAPGAVEGSKSEMIYNIGAIPKARLELKCHFCRSKRGACFQCSAKKCIRAYHATCAAAAGVLVEVGDVPVYGEDGVEYKDIGTDFRCRYHRPKRAKNIDNETLENSQLISDFARSCAIGDTVQMQYLTGEIFAGIVVENSVDEEILVVNLLPGLSEKLEIPYKYILPPDPAESQLPKASENAIPINHVALAAAQPNYKQTESDLPQANDVFDDISLPERWAEFDFEDIPRNPDQKPASLDFAHYLADPSTDAFAYYSFKKRSKVPDLRAEYPPTKPTPKAVAKACSIYLGTGSVGKEAVKAAASLVSPPQPLSDGTLPAPLFSASAMETVRMVEQLMTEQYQRYQAIVHPGGKPKNTKPKATPSSTPQARKQAKSANTAPPTPVVTSTSVQQPHPQLDRPPRITPPPSPSDGKSGDSAPPPPQQNQQAHPHRINPAPHFRFPNIQPHTSPVHLSHHPTHLQPRDGNQQPRAIPLQFGQRPDHSHPPQNHAMIHGANGHKRTPSESAKHAFDYAPSVTGL
jgi:hypothetical protein